jgi:hypothetical protein
MPNIKHIGRIKNNKRRVIVAYRTLPGDPYSALVVMTESLPAEEHDALVKLVESPAGQSSYELAEAMARTYLPDGRNMLSGFHTTGQLKKVSTSDIEMLPDNKSVIDLNKLNEIIAQQKGVSLEDLSLKPTVAQEPSQSQESVQPAPVSKAEPLSNDELAAQLRSQADAMFKEAKRLREQAEDINPTKKKSVKTNESV